MNTNMAAYLYAQSDNFSIPLTAGYCCGVVFALRKLTFLFKREGSRMLGRINYAGTLFQNVWISICHV
jgi:hypothetical protein